MGLELSIRRLRIVGDRSSFLPVSYDNRIPTVGI
jgi:hypothetical protein